MLCRGEQLSLKQVSVKFCECLDLQIVSVSYFKEGYHLLHTFYRVFKVYIVINVFRIQSWKCLMFV